MALQVNIETIYGVDVTYHKVVKVNYDFRTDTGEVILDCYKDKATRLEDKAPLINRTVFVKELDDLSQASLYTAIKSNDEAFSKAKDV